MIIMDIVYTITLSKLTREICQIYRPHNETSGYGMFQDRALRLLMDMETVP